MTLTDQIIHIATTKPTEDARREINALIAKPTFGWITTQDGKRIPLHVG